jgi:hypothetical protein
LKFLLKRGGICRVYTSKTEGKIRGGTLKTEGSTGDLSII